ncbi:hypothetical protein WJ59_15540 [Burkholderia gladioli]|nr:hypothetical protein WJ59_15540 [Burkholderia gladioli]
MNGRFGGDNRRSKLNRSPCLFNGKRGLASLPSDRQPINARLLAAKIGGARGRIGLGELHRQSQNFRKIFIGQRG